MYIYNQPSDFDVNPVTIPANQLMTVTDANQNIAAQSSASRPDDQTDTGQFAIQFEDTTVYHFPLTLSFLHA